MGKVHRGTISNVSSYDRQGNWALTTPEHAGMGLRDLCTWNHVAVSEIFGIFFLNPSTGVAFLMLFRHYRQPIRRPCHDYNASSCRMTDDLSVGLRPKADSSNVGVHWITDTIWIKNQQQHHFSDTCPLDGRRFKGWRMSEFRRFMQFWLALWKE